MFETRLKETAKQVETHLLEVMAPFGDLPVVEAMRYASAGGKRLRAFLVMESARLHGVDASHAIWPFRLPMTCWMSKVMPKRLEKPWAKMQMRARRPLCPCWGWKAPRSAPATL